MDLKRRLIISNAAIVVIPVLITLAASFAFIFILTRVFNTDISYESIKRLTRIEYEFFRTDGGKLQENPEMLLEKEFQQHLAARLSSIDSHVVVIKKHDIVFSTKNMSKIDVEKCLATAKRGMMRGTVELEGSSYIVKVISVAFRDGEQGKVILLAHLGEEDIITKKFLLFVLVVFVVSFLATNVLLAFVFSERILKPLGRLKAAAVQISRGNLDHEVIEEGDAEIRELCRSFEQMRLKLKESVNAQMKYDENRKILVSSISHDLKTPITSIRGYVEGIMDGVANTPEKVEKYLNTIYSKAAQIDGMIDDLLLYSRLDLKQIPFNFENVDIVKYFEDSVTENEAELEKAGIRLRLINELKGCRHVMMDREKMQRVVTNIIDNARKYMNKPAGEVDIILRETDSAIVVEIKDNGSGIAKEDLHHIFDRFYRADASRSRTSGSGLGLAIAKQIIEGHGGKIWARSRENEGTSIMMSLKKINQKVAEVKR